MLNPRRSDFPPSSHAPKLPVAWEAKLRRYRFILSIGATSSVRISVVLNLRCVDLHYTESHVHKTQCARQGFGCCCAAVCSTSCCFLMRLQCGSAPRGLFPCCVCLWNHRCLADGQKAAPSAAHLLAFCCILVCRVVNPAYIQSKRVTGTPEPSRCAAHLPHCLKVCHHHVGMCHCYQPRPIIFPSWNAHLSG